MTSSRCLRRRREVRIVSEKQKRLSSSQQISVASGLQVSSLDSSSLCPVRTNVSVSVQSLATLSAYMCFSAELNFRLFKMSLPRFLSVPQHF